MESFFTSHKPPKLTHGDIHDPSMSIKTSVWELSMTESARPREIAWVHSSAFKEEICLFSSED